MPAPIEFRHYLRYFTLDDAKAGIQPVRAEQNKAVTLFMPPVLQFRYREKTMLNGAPALEWSEWSDVQFAREGDD